MHVLVNGLVLRAPMGGALRYALETLPRCGALLHARGGRLSVLLAQAEADEDWVQKLQQAEHVNVDFVDAPMHPALRRALREPHAVQSWIDRSTKQGVPVHVVQTQSLPIPRLRLEGEQVHLCHGLRRLKTGPTLIRHFATALFHKGVRPLHSLLAVSENLAGELRELFPHRPVALATPGCNHQSALERKPSSEVHVICPGPVVDHKNHGLLVEAWASDESLPPLRLHAAEGPGARSLQAQIQRQGLQDRITWHAPLTGETWPQALAQCGAVVLPSSLESFGMVALETLHSGAPLALSDPPAHREVVGDADDAVVFFSPHDAKQCAAALHLALAQTDSESEAKRRARSRAFTWDATAMRTVEHWYSARS